MIVTDDMVSRAYRAWRDCPQGGEAFRLALEAALNPPAFLPGDFIMTPKWQQVHKGKAVPAIVIPADHNAPPLPAGSIRVWIPGLERADVFSSGFLIGNEVRLATADEIEDFRAA